MNLRSDKTDKQQQISVSTTRNGNKKEKPERKDEKRMKIREKKYCRRKTFIC